MKKTKELIEDLKKSERKLNKLYKSKEPTISIEIDYPKSFWKLYKELEKEVVGLTPEIWVNYLKDKMVNDLKKDFDKTVNETNKEYKEIEKYIKDVLGINLTK